jgi:hypothetical protein
MRPNAGPIGEPKWLTVTTKLERRLHNVNPPL